MKKVVTLASLFLMYYFTGFSQSDQENYDRFVPPSPTVAELSKYGNIPVSHYTGIPNISVPIYTLQCGQLSLPVSLSYYAGGVRVEQIASWVGLGWSLNAGGVISSAVMGLSDISTSFPLGEDSLISRFDDYNTFPTLSNANSMANGFLDSQPDIYSYNFSSYSGQFIRDNEGKFWDLKNNKQIKISYNGSTFKITDSNGTVYEFGSAGRIETSTREAYAGGYSVQFNNQVMYPVPTVYVPSAWFLTSITSADGVDKLEFSYADEQEIQQYQTPLQGKISYDFAYNNKVGRWVGASDEWGNTLNVGRPFSYSQITNQTWRLASISAKRNNNPIAIIRFIDGERLDFYGSRKLNSIHLEEAVGDGSNGNYGNIVKQWNFNYSYFGAYYLTGNYNENERLKLLSVTEVAQGTTGQKYSFKYYGDAAGEPNKMPPRLSLCGYDYWGYANASSGTVTQQDGGNVKKLFPNNISYTFLGSQHKQQCAWEPDEQYPCAGYVFDTSPRTVTFAEGSNKAPDINYTKTFSLKELHYPMGGYTKFNYEANDHTYSRNNYDDVVDSIQVCGGLRIKSIEDYDANGELKSSKSYRYKSSHFHISDEGDLWYCNELSSGSLIGIFNPFAKKSSKFYPENSGCDGLIIVSQNTVELSSSSHSSLYSSYGGEYMGYSEVEEVDENGFKRYKFYSPAEYPAHSQSNSKMAWYNTNGGVPEQHRIDRNKLASYSFPSENRGKNYARGLVKSIEAFDVLGRIVSSELYSYNFTDIHQIYGMEVMKHPDDYEYYSPSCPPGIGLAPYISGWAPPIVYGYEFYPAGFCFNVYYHQIGQALLRSKSVILFDNTTDCYCTVPEYGFEYEYQVADDDYMIDILMNNKNNIGTLEYYTYNAYNQPVRTDSYRSDGQIETTVYKYPLDMINNPDECNTNDCNIAVMQGMDAKFISPVIKTEKRVNGMVVSADSKKYVQVSSNMYRPEKIFQLETVAPLDTLYSYSAQMKEKVHYTSYNGYGKVSSLIAADNTPVVYLWAYQGQYPVAEIKNATYEQVRDALGGETVVSNLANGNNPTMSAINNLRTVLPNAQVSTFTYQPLVGMLTATDPRGIITYYEYDVLGRLYRTYIMENGAPRYIQHYQYNYINPQ